MLVPVILTVAGCVLVAYAAWARMGRSTRARWWPGSRWNESAVLFALPGIGLMLVAAGPLSTYGGGGPDWTFWFVPVLALGAVFFLWGALFIPVPRWYAPAWTRDESTTVLESRVTGLKARAR